MPEPLIVPVGWTRRRFELALLRRRIAEHGGNMTAAAASLKISRRTIFNLLRELPHPLGQVEIAPDASLRQALSAYVQATVQAAGNLTAAAVVLGISRLTARTLCRLAP